MAVCSPWSPRLWETCAHHASFVVGRFVFFCGAVISAKVQATRAGSLSRVTSRMLTLSSAGAARPVAKKCNGNARVRLRSDSGWPRRGSGLLFVELSIESGSGIK